MAAQWYYAKKNGEREGPVSPAKLKRLAAVRLQKLDVEAKRLPQEQPAPGMAMAPAGGGNVVVINQAPARKWSPGLAAVNTHESRGKPFARVDSASKSPARIISENHRHTLLF